MVVLSPMPVYLANLMRGAQVQRMKKVRVVTPCSNNQLTEYFCRAILAYRALQNVSSSAFVTSLHVDPPTSHERHSNDQVIRVGEQDELAYCGEAG